MTKKFTTKELDKLVEKVNKIKKVKKTPCFWFRLGITKDKGKNKYSVYCLINEQLFVLKKDTTKKKAMEYLVNLLVNETDMIT